MTKTQWEIVYVCVRFLVKMIILISYILPLELTALVIIHAGTI